MFDFLESLHPFFDNSPSVCNDFFSNEKLSELFFVCFSNFGLHNLPSLSIQQQKRFGL